MKKFIYFLAMIILSLFTVSLGIAQLSTKSITPETRTQQLPNNSIIGDNMVLLPTYNLTVKNWTLNTPGNNEVEFDIILENTSSETFEYASGQFFFTFNSSIASDNSELEYSIVPNSSELPGKMQPRMLGNGIGTFNENPGSGPSTNILRLAFNSVPGCGNGFMIPAGSPGIRIIRMRLTRTSGQFNHQMLNLEWRNPPTTAFATKIFAYIHDGKNCKNTDITTSNTHSIDPFGALPIELASFTSSVNRNNVLLNWTTVKEFNNSGFDIERNKENSNEWIKAGNVSGNGTTDESKSYSFEERINTGKYNYRLKQTDYNGNFSFFNLSNEVEVGIPDKFSISQNYPNPFNPTTKIDYDIPFDGKVSIIVYDLLGREITNLVNQELKAGYYTLQFNAANFASGFYFYRISAKNFVATKKMVVLK